MLHERSGPKALALFRITVFGIWAFTVVTAPPLVLAAGVPFELFSAPGILAILPEGFWQGLLASETGLRVLALTVFALALAAAGGAGPFWLVGPLAFVGVLLFDGIHKGFGGYVNHAQFGLLYAALLIVVSPAADALRLGPRKANRERPPAQYRFPLLGTALLIALTYALIGLHRLAVGGLEIFTGDALPTYMALRTVEYGPWRHEWSVPLLGIPLAVSVLKAGFAVTTLFEVLSPLALVWRRFRWLWLGVIIPFHVVTLVTMNILFWENLILLVFLFTSVPEWCERHLSAWRRTARGSLPRTLPLGG